MKPEWCPQEVWETALSLEHGALDYEQRDPETGLYYEIEKVEALNAIRIARALLEAEQRGRKAGLEDVSETIKKYRDLDGSTGAEWDDGYEAAYADIAAAIRAKLDEVQK